MGRTGVGGHSTINPTWDTQEKMDQFSDLVSKGFDGEDRKQEKCFELIVEPGEQPGPHQKVREQITLRSMPGSSVRNLENV